MTEVTLITIGTLKEDYMRAAAADYAKKVSGLCKFEEINLKEERIPDEEDKTAIAAALDAEGEQILKRVPKGAYLAVLAVEGKKLDSVALANKLSEGAARSGKLCFVIGSSHGITEKVKRAADFLLSVSDLTFPHQLMRVMFLEILYRSFSILAGKKYHK